MTADPYVYPGTDVLKNKLGIHDGDELDRAERKLSAQRASEDLPTGKFDLKHLKALHRHLFQDVFAWAGEIRTVNIAKGGNTFIPTRFIESGMADVHARLKAGKFHRGLDLLSFANEAAATIGNVNYVHPFREGNGRTQLLYLGQLADRAGHQLDLEMIDGDRWMEASRAAHQHDFRLMAEVIQDALSVSREAE